MKMRKFEVKKMKIVRLFTFCHQSIGPSQINNKQTNKTINKLERYHLPLIIREHQESR